MQNNSLSWRTDVLYPEFKHAEVLVWQIPLSLSELDHDITNQLSSQEQQRLQRLSNPSSQCLYAETRIKLRNLLAHYIGCKATDINYQTNQHGKPYIKLAKANGTDLFFNLSHSGDIALIALCRDSEIGIDIELENKKRDMQRLARRFFHPDEFQVIAALQEPLLSECFFRTWTRKEAFVKAVGTGIGFPLSAFQVDPYQAKMLWIDNSRYSGPCELHDLPLPQPYYASLATLATGFSLKTILWQD